MSMQEALRRIAECKRTQNTVLDLRNLGLTRLPDELWELTHLEVLLLGDYGLDRSNRIATLPPQLSALRGLKSLRAANIQLEKVPTEIGNLTALETLALGDNLLTEIPKGIGNLGKLQVLNIRNNRITRISSEMGQLSHLQELDLKNNQISILPPEIGHLHQLVTLNVRTNQLSNIPETIGELQRLQDLFLGENHIVEIPLSIGELHRLQGLTIDKNRLTHLPPTIGQLNMLESLHLQDNQLTKLPSSIGHLKGLKFLYLEQNQLTELPVEIGSLSSLEILRFSDNQLTTLPYELTQLTTLTELHLSDNPLTLPEELLFSDPTYPAAILDYLRAAHEERTVPYSEVKVVLVGEAGVGKSALVRRLVTNTFEPARSPTRGIAVQDWQLSVNGRDLTLHLWDFGGQEIMHNTHRLFLSARSLYLLVADNTRNPEGNRIEEWLKTIRHYAPEAPILVVSNKSDLDSAPLAFNQTELRRTYDIAGFYKVSCESGAGIALLQNAMTMALAQMPHLNDAIPARWMAVRQAVAEQNRDFLEWQDFRTLCAAQGVADTGQSIADFLHLLGVLLYYRARRATESTQILNPNWVTEGIYPLLTTPALIERKTGILTDSDLDDILDPAIYPRPRHSFILGMMYTFELAFELGNERHLVPDLLPKDEPAYEWEEGETLCFVYDYDYLPPGLFTRLIVALQHQIVPQWVWRGGAILYHRGQPYARLLVRPSLNRIEIGVRPPATLKTDPRTLLDTIRDAFDRLHDHALTDKTTVRELIPYGTGMILYSALLDFEAAGQVGDVLYPPHGKIPVGALLNGIRAPAPRTGESGGQSVGSDFFPGAPPWRVAAFFANPPDSARLPALRDEERQVRDVISRQAKFDLDTIMETRLRDLQTALDRKGKPMVIFHYSGHADDDGIWLEGESGQARHCLGWVALARELRHQPALRCVVLNSCRSLSDAFIKGFGRKPPAIIAMSAPIGDRKATIFATRFYETLVSGDALHIAFDKACNALRAEGYEADADIPRLIMADG